MVERKQSVAPDSGANSDRKASVASATGDNAERKPSVAGDAGPNGERKSSIATSPGDNAERKRSVATGRGPGQTSSSGSTAGPTALNIPTGPVEPVGANTWSSNTLLLLVLAAIFSPLAVYLVEGCGRNFLINLFLVVLWPVNFVHAVCVIIRDGRTNAVLAGGQYPPGRSRHRRAAPRVRGPHAHPAGREYKPLHTTHAGHGSRAGPTVATDTERTKADRAQTDLAKQAHRHKRHGNRSDSMDYDSPAATRKHAKKPHRRHHHHKRPDALVGTDDSGSPKRPLPSAADSEPVSRKASLTAPVTDTADDIGGAAKKPLSRAPTTAVDPRIDGDLNDPKKPLSKAPTAADADPSLPAMKPISKAPTGVDPAVDPEVPDPLAPAADPADDPLAEQRPRKLSRAGTAGVPPTPNPDKVTADPLIEKPVGAEYEGKGVAADEIGADQAEEGGKGKENLAPAPKQRRRRQIWIEEDD